MAKSNTTQTLAALPRAWRYVSSPWVVMIFLFGFLPWSEVACNSKEVAIRLTQSGYQGLYGGVSAPSAVEEMLEAQASERMNSSENVRETRQGLHKQLGVERSYLANVSPFLVCFWGANLALFAIICFAPLGNWRLGFALPLCGVMLAILVLHACLGMPLERRVGQVVAEVMREDPSEGLAMLTALKNGKTIWFWLTLASVGLLAVSEPLLNWLRAERWNGWRIPGSITGAAAMLMLGGVVVQFAVRNIAVSGVENRIAQLRQMEEERNREAKAERVRREADIRKWEAEADRLRQQVALKEQEGRILEQRRQQEREEQERLALREQRKQQDEVRRKAEEKAEEEVREKARQAEAEAAREVARQAELERVTKEKAAKETVRKAELEKKGLPYYPRPLTLYEGHNAKGWYQLLRDRPNDARLWRQGITALVALKEEGMPFLLDHLSRQTTFKDRDASLRLIHVEYIHPHDLHKLLPCLDQAKAFPATRIRALSYLQERATDLNKRLVPEIEGLLKDMLTSSGQREETKEEIKSMLNTIRMEAK